MQSAFIWIGIIFCLSQSAVFSGLNLAYFSLSRLRLEIEADSGNKKAATVLALRQDPNLLLCTILWGNVSINVLLTLLSESVMAGVGSFVFSTFVITIVGEILPQAYFSRKALVVGAFLAPVIRTYQMLFYLVAKPSAMMLDKLIGKEKIEYLRESKIRHLLKIHIDSSDADIDEVEGRGALNFLSLDDLEVKDEGQQVQADSVIAIKFRDGIPQLPEDMSQFIKKVNSSGEKWVILTDERELPRLLLDADGFLRKVMLDESIMLVENCHRPIIVRNEHTRLEEVLSKLEVWADSPDDDVIDYDTILVWTETHHRIITGADIFGRLMRGIAVLGKKAEPANE